MSFNTSGWIDDLRAVDAVLATLPYPVFLTAAADLRGSGAGKVVLLYKFVEQVTGSPLRPRNQGSIGSCVAVGLAGALDNLMCTEIVRLRQVEEFKPACAEALYGLGRVEIGGGRIGGDGCVGAWAAKAVQQYGVIPMEVIGEYDLRRYQIKRCREWGKRGLPDVLEPTARKHPVRTISQVRSYEECRDAIANGYPVTLASSYGFSRKRDSEGFAKRSGSWNHQMYAGAVDDAHRRPGVLIVNSWGVFNSGPKRHEQPDGSFWVDADVIDGLCRSGDCWAYSDFEGYPPKELNLRIM